MNAIAILILACCGIAGAYQLVALVASLAHRTRRERGNGFSPTISILKPVHGLDHGFYEAILSHATQSYPQFEILFGVSDPNDPAIGEIRRLQQDFPDVSIELVFCTTQAPNPKVAKLIDLAKRARYEVLLVNDSDIKVPENYLDAIVQSLADPAVGLVTCLYRVQASTVPAHLEALGVATDFAPGTLVAPWVGVKEFGLGATLLFRRADLKKLGGFDAIAAYVADDYQLAKRICGLGMRVHMSSTVVETAAGPIGWREAWQHQLRWQRTIRVSRGDGYAGLPVTFATLWAVIAMLAGFPVVAASLLLLRLAMALVVALMVLGCRTTTRYWPLIPVRDLIGCVVWLAAWCGNSIHWRGRNLQLLADGRIDTESNSASPALSRCPSKQVD